MYAMPLDSPAQHFPFPLRLPLPRTCVQGTKSSACVSLSRQLRSACSLACGGSRLRMYSRSSAVSGSSRWPCVLTSGVKSALLKKRRPTSSDLRGGRSGGCGESAAWTA